jgi:hypothetical protein
VPDVSALAMPLFASLALIVVPGPAGTVFIGLGMTTALAGGNSD